MMAALIPAAPPAVHAPAKVGEQMRATSVSPGDRIRASDFQELRNRVK